MSTIPWLGEVYYPTIAAKRVYEIVLGKMLQTGPSTHADVEVPYLKSASIQWDGVRADPNVRMWASPVEADDLEVRPGDLLVCEGGDVGRAAIYSGPPGYIFQNSVHRARARGGSDIRYFRYVLSALHGSDWLAVLCNKATIRHLTGDKLGALEIPLPPPEEQRRIADFLDAETARIDRLVVLRGKQVDLLLERLTARATQLTGRKFLREGTAADRKMRVALRRAVCSVQTGTTPSGLQEIIPHRSDLIPWYTPAAIDAMLSVGQAEKAIPSGMSDEVPIFPSGSVLITGIGESLGKVGYLEHEATGNQQLTALKPASRVDGRFLAWQLWAAQEEAREWAQYSRVRIINNEVLKAFPIYLPPLEEQLLARIELDSRRQDSERLRDAVSRFSEKMAEHRQALITAAVTRQIDVSTASGRGIED